MKLLIQNARIYDGTGSAPFPGDVLVKDDCIERALRSTGRAIRVR